MTTISMILIVIGTATVARSLMAFVDAVENGAKKDRATAGTVTRSGRC